MMTPEERIVALQKMQKASDQFYDTAIHIGVHQYIEFCGVMNEFIKLCENAHKNDIDFTDCNIHTGISLPMTNHSKDYINEKLECIFTGQSIIDATKI